MIEKIKYPTAQSAMSKAVLDAQKPHLEAFKNGFMDLIKDPADVKAKEAECSRIFDALVDFLSTQTKHLNIFQ